MTDLRTVIDPRAYRDFAGPDWPSLEDIIAGRVSAIPEIADEVADFVRMQRENYSHITQSGAVLAQANQQRQGQQFYDKQYLGPHCRAPWNTVSINANGDAYNCDCPSWVPVVIGNILQVNDIFDLLNSTAAQSIRQEILAGRYYYCNNRICGFFTAKNPQQYRSTPTVDQPLPPVFSAAAQVQNLPTDLILDFDYTCNLHCGSCRTEVLNYNADHVRRPINDQIAQKIKTLIIDRVTRPMMIRWCGGEPFISAVYLDLLEYIAQQQNPAIQHTIQTNGHYLQSRSELIHSLAPTIAQFKISFDAATADTYAVVRRGGSWNHLINNVKWLLQQTWPFEVTADFVVQRDNYREIPAFVELCSELGIKHINWQKMWNWGTWGTEEFQQRNVYDAQHPEYPALCEQFALAKQTMRY